MDTGRVTLYIATSVDGFVADADGSVDWLEGFEDEAGYEAFLRTVDCLVMGSVTYEQVLGFGDWPYGDRPTYVLTGRELPLATDSVELVEEEPAVLADRLRREHGHVWLVGGPRVARSFLEAGAVDALRQTVVPVLLGDGIPLFGTAGRRRELSLVGATTRDGGLAELQYELAG